MAAGTLTIDRKRFSLSSKDAEVQRNNSDGITMIPGGSF